MDKEDVVDKYNGLLAIKKEWNNSIFSNMNGPRDYHTKWSTSERERQKYDITYTWNLLKRYKWIYLQNRSRLTDIQIKLLATKRERGRAEFEIWD